MEVMMRG